MRPRASWSTQKFRLRNHLVSPTWEVNINPREGRDGLFTLQIYQPVGLQDLLALKGTWLMAVPVPHANSKEGDEGLTVAGRIAELFG